MSEDRHVKEPWEVTTGLQESGSADHWKNWIFAVSLRNGGVPFAAFGHKEDAERAALCVNACKGIPENVLRLMAEEQGKPQEALACALSKILPEGSKLTVWEKQR